MSESLRKYSEIVGSPLLATSGPPEGCGQEGCGQCGKEVTCPTALPWGCYLNGSLIVKKAGKKIHWEKMGEDMNKNHCLKNLRPVSSQLSRQPNLIFLM